jgi:hypothetical protein
LPIEGLFEVVIRPSEIVADWSSEVLVRSIEMGEVSSRGGSSTFARARWWRCRRGEELSHFLERDGGGVGEGRAFIICSIEMGEVSARGGAFIFSRARWCRCR